MNPCHRQVEYYTDESANQENSVPKRRLAKKCSERNKRIQYRPTCALVFINQLFNLKYFTNINISGKH